MSTVSWVGSPAGTMIHTARGASSLPTRSSSPLDPLRAVPLGLLHGVLGEVERHHLVIGVAMDAMDHVAAHLPETDETELHGFSSHGAQPRGVT